MPGYARPTTVVLSTEVVTQPTGDISATSLQPALAEIASEKIPVAIIDAKGDLIVGSASDTAIRLPISGDGTVLAANASAAGGMSWTNSPTVNTVKTTNIQNPFSTNANAVTTAGGDLTNAAGVSFMGGSKNLLYNGAMQVAQRGTSTASITGGGYYTADRWATEVATQGTWTQSVENDAPTGSGLSKSLKMLCTTADAAPAAGDIVNVVQYLEGQDLQRIAKGTASAQQLTLSFWVKSNVTGTYTILVFDNSNTRMTSFAYTISASATWEKKTVVVPADTTGALANTNAHALSVFFCLGAGSNFTSGSLQATWAAYTAANRSVGQVNVAAATNNYWQVTGVQLEVGPVATSFEFKSFGQELAECQRYYQLHASGSGIDVSNGNYYDATTAVGIIHLPVQMRETPNLEVAAGTNYYNVIRQGTVDGIDTITVQASNTRCVGWYNNTQASGASGVAFTLRTNNASSKIAFSAEL